MTAIFGSQLADEFRFPDRLETVRHAGLAQAAVAGVDEDNLAVFLYAKLVNINIAGGLHIARNIDLVVDLVGSLAGGQHIFHPDDLGQRAKIDAVAITDHAHRLRIDRLMQGQLAVGTMANQIEAPGLIGGEADRDIVAGQKSGETLRKINVDLVCLGGVGGRRFGRGVGIFRADFFSITIWLVGLLAHARFPC